MAVRAEPRGIPKVFGRIRRTQNHDRYVAALRTLTHSLDNVSPRSSGKIQIDDCKIRTRQHLRLNILYENNSGLAISKNHEFSLNAVHLEALPNQSHIRWIVFNQKDEGRVLLFRYRLGLL